MLWSAQEKRAGCSGTWDEGPRICTVNMLQVASRLSAKSSQLDPQAPSEPGPQQRAKQQLAVIFYLLKYIYRWIQQFKFPLNSVPSFCFHQLPSRAEELGSFLSSTREWNPSHARPAQWRPFVSKSMRHPSDCMTSPVWEGGTQVVITIEHCPQQASRKLNLRRNTRKRSQIGGKG